MAAEAIGFDVGRPLMIVNCAQLMDKYVGELKPSWSLEPSWDLP